jgi:flagellar motor switch protein FliM
MKHAPSQSPDAVVSEVKRDLPQYSLPKLDVTPIALGQKANYATIKTASMNKYGERIGRRFRDIVELFSRTKSHVNTPPVEIMNFVQWKSEAHHRLSLNIYRLPPLKGLVLVSIDVQFIHQLVDCYYGGTGTIPERGEGEFTGSEERLITRLTDEFMDVVAGVSELDVTLSPVIVTRETNLDSVKLARSDEQIFVQRFEISCGPRLNGILTYISPVEMLRPVVEKMNAEARKTRSSADDVWRHKMDGALQAVRFPVRTILARPTMSVDDLLALKVGDIIPINLAARVPMFVANRQFAIGTMGEQQGRAAFMVESIVKGDGQ